jgi:hypothetical protein
MQIILIVKIQKKHKIKKLEKSNKIYKNHKRWQRKLVKNH